RAEPAPGAGHDDADDPRILLRSGEGMLHLAPHAGGPRVESVGAIQRDDGGGLGHLVGDLVVHAGDSFRRHDPGGRPGHDPYPEAGEATRRGRSRKRRAWSTALAVAIGVM